MKNRDEAWGAGAEEEMYSVLGGGGAWIEENVFS